MGNALRTPDDPLIEGGARAIRSRGLYLQWQARALGWACDDEVLERMRQDDHSLVEAFSMPLPEPPWVECAVALHHCHLFRIGRPDLRKYGLRSVDDTASLRAMALPLDLRSRMQSGADPISFFRSLRQATD